MSGWTDARVATLRKLWTEGHSASQIAKQLGGVTRSAVLGKLHRIGAPRRNNTARVSKTSRARLKRHVWRGPPKLKQPSIMEQIVRAHESQRVPLPDPLNIPLVDLGPGMCRAVTDATRYAQTCCGHAVEGEGPYCNAHAKLYRVPNVKRERVRA